MHIKGSCLDEDNDGTCVTFHLSKIDFQKPKGSIVRPLENELPKMLKVGATYIYRIGDNVVIREYSAQQHANTMVMVPSIQPGDFGIMTSREFDYLIECFFETGGLRSLIYYLDVTKTPDDQHLKSFEFIPDRFYHLGLGYEFRVFAEEKLLSVTSTEYDRHNSTRILKWHVTFSFADVMDMLKDIRLLIPRLPLEERNCLAHFPLDHMNQEGMMSCLVCQYFNDDYDLY
ncbi:unnamed protein product [Owenia fusiformis]|uniref:Uncharacterized protein n=1 Tax=Owenia fusiformis TaxID=6347 RepID=A0A8J1TE24_OWEFU|nr:unnamed protein product [Owenia fusiformis]